ncbi:MAG: hypothetical protein ACRCVL_01955, partial [Cetobacterium sp.]
DAMDLLAIVVMKGRRFCEMVWSIVEGSGSNGQVVGLQDWMSCRISSAVTVEKCDNKGVGESIL